MPVELICNFCGTKYFKSPSKAKNSKYCSRICGNKAMAQNKKIDRENKKCNGCEKTFLAKENSDRKYCSRGCMMENVKVPRVELKCHSCGKNYERPVGKETKFCSKDCQNFGQSAGLTNIPSNGRAGYRKDLPSNYFFKSSLEADYARYCNAIGKKYIYEHRTFVLEINGKKKAYTPDFYHPDEDRYVETKAGRKDKKYGGNLPAVDELKSQGIKIEVLFMRDFYRNIKQSGHYWDIDNIENKNYLGTRPLIYG